MSEIQGHVEPQKPSAYGQDQTQEEKVNLLVILYYEEWNYDELNIICIWKNYDEMIIQSILMK